MYQINDNGTDLRPALLELVNSGMRQAEIARDIGLSRATVNFAVKKKTGGWMPGYEAGRRLIGLVKKHRRATAKPEPEEANHAKFICPLHPVPYSSCD